MLPLFFVVEFIDVRVYANSPSTGARTIHPPGLLRSISAMELDALGQDDCGLEVGYAWSTRSSQPFDEPKCPNRNERKDENPSACKKGRSKTRCHDILSSALLPVSMDGD